MSLRKLDNDKTWRKRNFTSFIPLFADHQLQINDKVLVLYKQSTVNRGMCLLQGEWVKLKEKG